MDDQTSTTVSPAPTRPESLTFEFYEQNNTLTVYKNRGGGPPGIPYLLLVWTPICVYALATWVRDPSIAGFLAGTALNSIWLLLMCCVVWIHFGKETLVLQADRAVFLRTAFITLKKRVIPTKDIRVFRECRFSLDAIGHVYYGVEVITFEESLKCFFRLHTQEREWLISQFNQFLGIEPAEFSHSELALRYSLTGIATIEKSAEPPNVDPPLQSSWRLTIEPNSFVIAAKGGFHIAMFLALLLVNLLTVGLIASLALTLFGVDVGPWKHNPKTFGTSLVLLVLFSAMGLVLLIPLFFTILAPFTSAFWRFERSRIVCNRRYAMFSTTRTWNVRRLDRLELRRVGDEERQTDATTEGSVSKENELNLYDLVLITDKQTDLCSIDFATEEEAWWMAQTIYHRRPEWFGEPP